jgi:serine/threonine protein kinase
MHGLLGPPACCYRAHLDVVGPLGQGGFGSVVLALNTLDQRLTAVKQVRFTSSMPPWAQPQQLEAQHQRLLREVSSS